MYHKYEKPELQVITIHVQDIMLGSNELPEIDLHSSYEEETE